MKLISQPSTSLQGTVHLPGDKSLSHRAAIFAALAQGSSRIENFQLSGVTKVMLDALGNMGIGHTLDGTTLSVQGKGIGHWDNPAAPIHCGGSATTMRILAGAMALNGVTATLDGSARLRQRPMDRIVDPMRQMGIPVEAANGFAPLHLNKSAFPLKSLHYSLPVASAQVKTCLLLAALAADDTSILVEPGPSRDHTERLLRQQGIVVESEIIQVNGHRVYQTALHPPQRLGFSPLHLSLPGDFSSAAFLIVAAAIVPGSQIILRNTGLNPTRTGLLDALLAMGADIRILDPHTNNGEPAGDLVVRYSPLKGIDIGGEQVVRMIDEFPVFAVAAACAEGKTTVYDSLELRHKESDRISCLCNALRNLNVDITERPDGFVINGQGRIPGGGVTNSHHDHRLSMSMLVAGLAAPSTVAVQDAEVFTQSFPEFVSVLNALGAEIRQEEIR
jgi:3-phosphoshikimate 1-carboxyvinyltransferase